MNEKRETPYSRLLAQVRVFARNVKFPHRKVMWVYPIQRLSEGWSLKDLYERTKAADQLGYDVRVVAAEDGLRLDYIKRPDVPYDWA